MDYFMKKTTTQSDSPPTTSVDDKTSSPFGKNYREGETSTEAVGRIVYTKLFDKEPSQNMSSYLSQAVHIAYGALQGGVFALFGQIFPGTYLMKGALFGAVIWLLGDELAVPLLGLSRSPASISKITHMNYLKGHLVYGLLLGGIFLALTEDTSS